MVVEAVSYADLCIHQILSQELGYVMLEVVGRSLLEVLTFSVVTTLWLETAGFSLGRYGKRLLTVVALLLVISSVLRIYTMLFASLKWMYQTHVVVEACCWLLHATFALVSTVATTRRILRLSNFVLDSRGCKIMVKTVLPMMLCCTCYSVRAVWLVVGELRYEYFTPTSQRYSLAWWIGFTWIPTLVPSLLLLYSTRKRDVMTDSATTPLLLLSPPGPPAEAFVSFQRHLDSEESSFLWSPIPSRHLEVQDDDDGEAPKTDEVKHSE
jgi:hypothetical protein